MKSLKNKLVIIFCLVAILSTLATSFAIYRVSSESITKESLEKAKITTDKCAEEINNWFNHNINIVKEIGYNLNYTDNYEHDYLSNYLSTKLGKTEDIIDYYIALPTNVMISGTKLIPPKSFNVLERDWYKKAIHSNSPIISKPYIDIKTQELVFTISTKIERNNTLKGVIASDVNADIVLDKISNSNPIKNSYVFLVDNEGDILVHSEEQFKPKGNNFKNLKNILDGRLEKIITSKKGIELEKGYDGKDKYFIVSPIKSTDWKVCIVVPMDEIAAPLNKIIRNILVTIAITIIVSIIISFLMSISISKPIIAGIKHGEKIAQLNIKDDVPEKFLTRKDELGVLAASFQQIIDNFRKFTIEISTDSEKVAASSEELSATSEQSALAAENIAEATNNMATSSDSQLKEILDVISSMEQISASIQEIASNSDEITSLTKETFNHSNIGKEKVEKTTVQMNNIAISTKEIQSSLNDVNNFSGKINEFVNVIQSIAEQTNLLALNAAIEAARAGEHGKGFAVVAEEVRELAEGVQNAAEEINNLITENNKVLERTNTVVENNAMNVNQGITSINDTNKAFVDIATLIKKVHEQINVIAHSIEEVAKGSETIVDSASKMESISKTVSAEIQNVSASAEEQTSSMEEVSSACQDLAQIAEELNNLINKVNY